LAAYEGRTALSSFINLCLRDFRWWASFVQKETGKIKLPKALENESKPVQQIYFRLCWGWENTQSPAIELEIRSEAVQNWAALSVADHTLLRLVVESGGSTAAIGLGLPPWLRQTVKTHIAVRCKMLDRQDHCTAF
jgi:hypothetical protein